MARWNALLEIEEVKQPALIAALPTHHDPTPPLKPSTKRNHDSPIISTTFSTVSVIFCLASSPKARRLFPRKQSRGHATGAAVEGQTCLLVRDTVPISQRMIPFGTGPMSIDIGRRQFITALGVAPVAWPLAARAQQPTLAVIGFLGVKSTDLRADRLREFRDGMNESGFVEGQGVVWCPCDACHR
jgi:hypothetical protein